MSTAAERDDPPVAFVNHYRCNECGTEWDDIWSCTCDDRCPTCNTSISPYHSDDLDEET